MSSLDRSFQAPQEPQQQDPMAAQPTAMDLRDEEQSAITRDAFDQAILAGHDDAATEYDKMMRRQAFDATIQTMGRGADPARETSPIARYVTPDIEVGRRLLAFADRERSYKDFMRNDPELNEVREYMRGVYSDYEKQQDGDLPPWTPNTMSDEQKMDYLAQLRPVKRDPNEVAEIRSKMVSINNRMGEIDPAFNLWTNPKTKQWANWMNREAGVTGMGYLSSGEQELDMNILGKAAYTVGQGAEAVTDFGLAAGYQVWEWGDAMMRGMGMPSIAPPVNYIEGPNGEIFFNAERPHPGFYESTSAFWSMMQGRSVIRDIAKLNRERQLADAQAVGFDAIMYGTAKVAGSFLGFGLPAGWAISRGSALFANNAQKGLTFLGALGLKGAQSARAQNLVKVWGGRFGGAAGLGGLQTTAYGKQNGYTREFLMGSAMYPVLAFLGHYGGRLEKALKGNGESWARGKAAQMISEGTMMGMPFALMEHANISLFNHIKNPNEETWQIYVKNFMGAAIFKGAMGGRPLTAQQEAFLSWRARNARAAARRAWAEDYVNGLVEEGALGRFKNVEAGDMKILGDMLMREKSSTDVMERMKLQAEREAYEAELDVKEFGLGSQVQREAEKLQQQEDMTEEEAAKQEQPDFVEEAVPPKPTPRQEAGQLRERRLREDERIDPLEEPDFGDRPFAERKMLLEADDAGARRRIAAELDKGADRYRPEPDQPQGLWKVKDTRTGETVMTAFESRKQAEDWAAEMHRRSIERQVEEGGLKERRAEPEPERPLTEDQEALRQLRLTEAAEAGEGLDELGRLPTPEERKKGARAGPGSFQAQPERQIETVKGFEETTKDEIFAELQGRPTRKGIRIPFTEKRIGRKEGDPVRMGIHRGYISSPSATGLYKLFENLIRLRFGRDITTATHEWSHAMQRFMQAERGGMEFIEAGKAWVKSLPKELRKEFDTILTGYPGQANLPLWRRGMEVWAEWHARELLSDHRLEPEVPLLTAYFRKQLAAPRNARILAQFQRIQGLITRYTMIGAEGRLAMAWEQSGELATETMRATRPTRYEQARDNILRNYFDDVLTMKRGQEDWLEMSGRDPASIGIMEDPGRLWDALRLVAPKQTYQLFMKGITMPDGRHTPGVGQILEATKGRERDFTSYLFAVVNANRIALRNKARHLAMSKGQRPPPELAATTSYADLVWGWRTMERRHSDFRQLRKQLKAWTDSLVDWVAEAGSIPQWKAQTLKDHYTLWLPMFRLMEGPGQHAQVGGGGRVLPAGEAIGRIKHGGTERVRHPVAALYDAASHMISNAHRQMIVKALYKMGRGGEAGGMATIIDPSKVPHDFPLRQVFEALDKKLNLPEEQQFFFEDMVSGLQEAGILDKEMLTLFAQRIMPPDKKNIVAFTPRLSEAEIMRTAAGDPGLEAFLRRDNNTHLWMQIDRPIYETLIGLDVFPTSQFYENNVVGKAFRMTARLKRYFATGISTGFLAANIFRDALSQPVFTQDGRFAPFTGFLNWTRGAVAYHAQQGPGSIRELYDVMGVRLSGFYEQGARRQIIGEAETLMSRTKGAFEKLEEVFSHPENYIRIHEFQKIYERAKEDGKTEMEARLLAAEAGREITVNFARAGTFARAYNGMTPYFNASLQGQRKLWRQILIGGDGKNDAQRVRIQRAAWMNAITSITLPALGLWAAFHDTDWYRDLPGWRKAGFFNFPIGDTIVSLPKPFELGTLFGAIPEAFMEAWVAENGTPPTMGTLLIDGLFPYFKGPGAFLPALIQPMVELTTNWDFFRGRPMTPEWLVSNRIPEQQYTMYTSEAAKAMSLAFGGKVTPMEIEKIIGGYSAGYLTYAARVIEDITGIKDHPGFRANPMQRFFRSPHRQGFFAQEVYHIEDILDQKAGSRTASIAEMQLRGSIGNATRMFAQIQDQVQAGTITAEQAERRKFEIAEPLIRRWQNIQR